MPEAVWLEAGWGTSKIFPSDVLGGSDLVIQHTANKWVVVVDRILDVDRMIK